MRILITALIIALASCVASATDPLAPSLNSSQVADVADGLAPACALDGSFCLWRGPPRVCTPDGQHCTIIPETVTRSKGGPPSISCNNRGHVMFAGDFLLNGNLFSGKSEVSGTWERHEAPGWRVEVACRKVR